MPTVLGARTGELLVLASELARVSGGVLLYGTPEFRLGLWNETTVTA